MNAGISSHLHVIEKLMQNRFQSIDVEQQAVDFIKSCDDHA